MSSTHDHLADGSDHGYGGGRTSRPLFALIPIGILMAVCLAMLVEGLHVMTSPSDTSAGETHIVQTVVPSSGPGAPAKG
jgi:hypothetical protein